MAKVVISVEDISTMFVGSLVCYKGSVVLFSDIDRNKNASLFHLEKQSMFMVKFDYDDFSPINGRLGYLNFGTFAAYCMRLPVRRYKIGLAPDNFKFRTTGFKMTRPEVSILNTVGAAFTSKAFVDTIRGIYPSFEEAFERVKEKGDRLVAFDRQFAISESAHIYYKDKVVGIARNNRMEDITWLEEKAYLKAILQPIVKSK